MKKKPLTKKEVFVKNHLQLSIKTVLLEKAPFEVCYMNHELFPFKVRQCISWEEYLHGLKVILQLMHLKSIGKEYFKENPLNYFIVTHDTNGKINKKPELIGKEHVIKTNGIRFK